MKLGTATLVRRLAKRFGVSVSTIKAILRNRRREGKGEL